MMPTRAHHHRFRVLYPDVDQGGVVHHSAYVRYFETGRIEWLRHHGYSYADLEKKDRIAMPVVELNVRYRRPVLFDDWVQVTTALKQVTQARMIFHSTIVREEEPSVVTTEGEVTLACIDLDGFKLRRFPEGLSRLV